MPGLPYRARVYVNNQVLVPASVVRTLGIEGVRYVDVTIRFRGFTIELRGVRLLRAGNTASRQFTIPREVRERYGIGPMDMVEVLDIRPSGGSREVH
ncbi:hypothetical protein [Vulcanisaeta sp. JCM 14467]|uniref:hypothetical protein n=1 Tax=Vulcanisaeta sp. JCM 14467 TaxID=1295370 RepID=UPI0006D08CCB|nr:hypothetical protein [Vulcanisaeta sp. JCM 14467]